MPHHDSAPPNSPRPRADLASLVELLRSMCSSNELRHIVWLLEGGDRLYAELPGDSATLAEFVTETTLLLNRHGRIDGAFFDALDSKYPGRREDIARVRAALGCDTPQTSAPSSPSVEPSADASEHRPSNLHLILDRTQQWETLINRCTTKSNENLAFLLHGDSGQDVHLFVNRIESEWQEDCFSYIHQTRRVPLRFGGDMARTADDWGRHLRCAAGFGSLPLRRALERVTSQDPVILLFCESPLSMATMKPRALDALKEFLTDTLPKCLSEGPFKHPIRLLVAVEHQHPTGPTAEEDPLVIEIETALRQAAGLTFQPLPTLDFPPWNDIELLLREKIFGPERYRSQGLRPKFKKVYDSVDKEPDYTQRTFSRLADVLDAAITAHLSSS